MSNARFTEKWFNRGLWLIAVIFAAFLIGLGGLIVRDLPRVENAPQVEQFYKQPDYKNIETQEAGLNKQQAVLDDERETLQLKLDAAAQQARDAEQTFSNWLANRAVTNNAQHNAEIDARTQALDVLKANERTLRVQMEGFDQKNLALTQQKDHLATQKQQLEEQANKAYIQAYSANEFKVFLYRLALTLPLLVLGVWLFVKKRKANYWPFVWGYVFFALFTFFVELVPYLPSYGGYVRFIVGIILTLAIGNFAIKTMRNYLAQQKAQEEKPSDERLKTMSYDTAMKRLSKSLCPSCERPVDLKDTTQNYCLNCGFCLFNNCTHCHTRKNAVAHYCHHCGEHTEA